MASLISSRFSYFAPSGDNTIYTKDDVKKEIQEPTDKWLDSLRKIRSISDNESNKKAEQIVAELKNTLDVAMSAPSKAKSETKSEQEETQTKPKF